MTHRNLHGLEPPQFSAEPAFAGDAARVRLTFRPSGLERLQITASMRERRRRFWTSGALKARRHFNLAANEPTSVALEIPTTTRGYHAVPAVSLKTRFPLGLFRAWTICDSDCRVLVYPRPAGSDRLPTADAASNGRGGANKSGDDELYELRRYREGDSFNKIAWRHFARRETLLTKRFAAPLEEGIHLRFSDLAHLEDVEEKLSQLTRWVLLAAQTGAAYTLELPDRTIGPAQGEPHRIACLSALAEF